MKRIICCLLLIALAFAAGGVAQSNSLETNATFLGTGSILRQRSAYYISVARANAAQFSKKQWQQTATTLKRAGIPAFFASHQSLPSSSQVRGEWLIIQITRRLPSAADTLMLGPFSSKAAASAAVRKLPNLLSDEGRPLNEDYPGQWSMGFYIILGERTK